MHSLWPFRTTTMVKPSCSRRRARRAVPLAAAAALVIAGNTLAVAPAHADGGLGAQLWVAYQTSANTLATDTNGGINPFQLGLESGTNPSISALSSNGYQVTFAANNDELWTNGPRHSGPLGQFLATGTSPSMTILTNGAYEIAFQGANGDLWTYNGNTGAQDMGLGMDNSTSPSITSQPNGGFDVAFQANTGDLWIAGSAGTRDLGLGMDNSTSPSITSPNGGGAQWEIAFQANTGHLWVAGTAGTGDTGLAMLNSPSITTVAANGGYQVAFVSPIGGDVEATGTYGTFDTNIPAMPHTSPSIAGARCGPNAYLLAWHSPIGGALGTLLTGDVSGSGTSQAAGAFTETNQLMNLTSSPSATSTGGC
jgi:hypothetical protein